MSRYSEDYNLDSRYWEHDPEASEAHTAKYFNVADSFEDHNDTDDVCEPHESEPCTNEQ